MRFVCDGLFAHLLLQLPPRSIYVMVLCDDDDDVEIPNEERVFHAKGNILTQMSVLICFFLPVSKGELWVR